MSSGRISEDLLPEMVVSRYWFDKCFSRVIKDKAVQLEYKEVSKHMQNCIERSAQSNDQVISSFLKELEAYDGSPLDR